MMKKSAKNVLKLQTLSVLASTGWYLVVLGQYRAILIESV